MCKEYSSPGLRNMTSVYLVGEGEILCLYRIGSRVADKLYVGAAGGHFEQAELSDPRACILREMNEELGLLPEDVAELKLRYITYRLKNGEIRQNYYFFGRLREPKELRSTEGILRWVKFEEFAELPMPVSAKHMIMDYLEHGRFNDALYGGITQAESTAFTEMEEF